MRYERLDRPALAEALAGCARRTELLAVLHWNVSPPFAQDHPELDAQAVVLGRCIASQIGAIVPGEAAVVLTAYDSPKVGAHSVEVLRVDLDPDDVLPVGQDLERLRRSPGLGLELATTLDEQTTVDERTCQLRQARGRQRKAPSELRTRTGSVQEQVDEDGSHRVRHRVPARSIYTHDVAHPSPQPLAARRT
jgi:hypothetical protein